MNFVEKIKFLALTLVAVTTLFFFQNCSKSQPGPENTAPLIQNPETTPAPQKTVLITASLSMPKSMNEFQAQDFLTKSGTNFFCFSQDWAGIETAPTQYDLQNAIINPLTLLVPQYSFKGVLLVIKMIDTNIRTMPADLQNKSFDDPQVLSRFLSMLHAIAQEPSSARLTHILLGNEVDAYFTNHPNELSAFRTLLQQSMDQLHKELPGVKVGTITTFDSLSNDSLFQSLTEYSDFIDYTYYPINGLSGGNVSKGWQMRPLNEVSSDLIRMSNAAAKKPFAFTEIGYSASGVNNSSEQLQSDFVTTVFDTFEADYKKNRVEFISWSSFADYSPDVCANYAAQQGIQPSTEFCAFLENLGLRTYTDNRGRKAWDTFINEVLKWTK